jgi:hypothetical protein
MVWPARGGSLCGGGGEWLRAERGGVGSVGDAAVARGGGTWAAAAGERAAGAGVAGTSAGVTGTAAERRRARPQAVGRGRRGRRSREIESDRTR